MKRRTFVAASLSCTMFSSLAHAQRSVRTVAIVIINALGPAGQIDDKSPPFKIVFDELRRRGYVEGQNLIVHRRSSERPARVAELVEEIRRLKPDLVFSFGDAVLTQLTRALATIPIVGITTDPVGSGLATSFSRPGGNFTGVTHTAGLDTFVKRVQFLVEMAPAAARIAYLGPKENWDGHWGIAVREAARRAGIAAVGMTLAEPIGEPEYQRVFAEASQQRIAAIFVDASFDNAKYGRLIVELAAQYRLPAIYPYAIHKKAGGLATYFNEGEMWGDVAEYIARVLNGENPAEMPIRQPTTFTLSINLATAKALGLTLSPALLARADEVIE